MPATTFIDDFILLLDLAETPDHGVDFPMPMIGSLDTLKPNEILIVTKRSGWDEFRKTQTFPASTPPAKIYRSLSGWTKQSDGERRITTISSFLSNPSNPQPYTFPLPESAKTFIPLEIAF